jgi:hypothetical protein
MSRVLNAMAIKRMGGLGGDAAAPEGFAHPIAEFERIGGLAEVSSEQQPRKRAAVGSR